MGFWKNVKKHTSFHNILICLGLATILGLVFAVVYLGLERTGVIPWLGVFMIPTFTVGENWIFFIGAILFTFFVGVVIIFLCIKMSKTRL